jgi:hypothetical protein
MSTVTFSRSRGLPWRLVGPLAALLAVALGYAVFPRQAQLTRFEPAAMARLETAMWRHYYEKGYAALLVDLYAMARDQQGFSPVRSVRMAVAAAGAARAFQPTTSRAEAQSALPWLIDYFRVLARAAAGPVNIKAAARSELDWWQARREGVSPEDYGLIIARVTTLLYGVDGEEVRQAGILRARAMAYRDARGTTLAEADWAAIEDQLRAAYELLKRAVAPGSGKGARGDRPFAASAS